MTTIQNPYYSAKLNKIIHTIEKLDEPYLSKIAEEHDTQVGQIQKYTETLRKKGWAFRRKGIRDGRKRIYMIKYDEIMLDYVERIEALEEYQNLSKEGRQQLLDILKNEIELQDSLSEAISKAIIVKRG